MPEPTSLDLLKAVLDPVRLAVLGRGVAGTIDIAEMSTEMGWPRGDVARAVGDLRASGLLRADGTVDEGALRSIAKSLPDSSGGRGQPVQGPWTNQEAQTLGRFFAGGRLIEIPSAARKRRLVVEKVALEFEPGRRYTEQQVNVTIQLIHDDYASIRRYMVDEGFMDRADGAYWRTGGRYGPPDPDATVIDHVAEPIATERVDVVLRPYDWGMLDALILAADDPRIPVYMGDGFASPYTREAAESWLDVATEPSPRLQYAIFVAGTFAGGVGAFLLDAENAGVAEIGWWLNPRFWGEGVVTCAVQAFIDEMFTRSGIERLCAPVMEPNRASARVAQKVGMYLEGTAPSHYVKHGVRMDCLNFGVTRSQWTAR